MAPEWSRVSGRRSTQRFEVLSAEPRRYPSAYAAHGHNHDNLYWGVDRFRFRFWRWLYAAARDRGERHGEGHRAESPFYWGDLAQRYLRYVRSFTYDELNLVEHHDSDTVSNRRHARRERFFPQLFCRQRRGVHRVDEPGPSDAT